MTWVRLLWILSLSIACPGCALFGDSTRDQRAAVAPVAFPAPTYGRPPTYIPPAYESPPPVQSQAQPMSTPAPSVAARTPLPNGIGPAEDADDPPIVARFQTPSATDPSTVEAKSTAAEVVEPMPSPRATEARKEVDEVTPRARTQEYAETLPLLPAPGVHVGAAVASATNLDRALPKAELNEVQTPKRKLPAPDEDRVLLPTIKSPLEPKRDAPVAAKPPELPPPEPPAASVPKEIAEPSIPSASVAAPPAGPPVVERTDVPYSVWSRIREIKNTPPN